MYVCLYMSIEMMYVCVYVYTHACACIYTHVCCLTDQRTRICTDVYTTWLHTFVYICITRVYICTYPHTRTYVCVQFYNTHTYVHLPTALLKIKLQTVESNTHTNVRNILEKAYSRKRKNITIARLAQIAHDSLARVAHQDILTVLRNKLKLLWV
jgi:hypothetical protein